MILSLSAVPNDNVGSIDSIVGGIIRGSSRSSQGSSRRARLRAGGFSPEERDWQLSYS
jgi:hypothetical protein